MSFKTPLRIQSWEKARTALKDVAAFVSAEYEDLEKARPEQGHDGGDKCQCDLCRLMSHLADARLYFEDAEEKAAEADTSNDHDCTWCGGSGGGDVPCQCRHCNGSGIEPGRGR